MSAETDQKLVQRFYEEILTERKPEAVSELVTSDYVCHSSHLPPDLPSGIEGARQLVTEFLSGYSQLRFTVGKQRVQGDTVYSEISAKSPFPVGPVMTIPVDPAVEAASDTITGTSTEHIVNGKIAESWIEFHVPDPLPQLEKMPDKDEKN